jgi:nucleotide-binding universal stress UspA family protein
VLGAPRRAIGGRRRLFGGTVDYVLREAPCRVLIASGARAA